ncbi:MAG TPA: hypothetical protein DEA40_01920 [Parvularcula sp.]|nr:hypothetical protein [Parvularcula sp.]HBS33642.1 hypothetical protein [Parvularcula sp.]
MAAVRIIIGLIGAVITGYLLSAAFLTVQTLTAYPGFRPELAALAETYGMNVMGLAAGSPFIAILAVCFAVAFAVAAILKRILRPLAPVAYVIGGAAALPALFFLVENVMLGGGVGAFFGARDPSDLALQALAGAAGGLVFTLIAVRK